VVRYLQLAHNERHPQTGNPVAKVIHSFGRAEQVDRAALARLVSSISRFLTPEEAVAAATGMDVEVLESRRLGGTWTLDRIWERLGIGAAIRRAATGRRLDGQAVERVVFALVAQRALEPGSKLAATKWAAQRVAVEGCEGFTDDAAYAAMDFLLDALDDIAGEIFSSVAHLLNLDLDIVFETRPRRTSRSTSPMSSLTCRTRSTTTASPGRSSRASGASGTPRTSARVCRRS